MTQAAVAYLRAPGELELDPEIVPAGVEIVSVFLDDDSTQRRGLAQALQSIASGDADALFVMRLSAAAGSLTELVRLLEWLEQADAALLAADVGLNTSDRSGRRLVQVLREIERWGREPDPARRPRGRPGMSAGAPELARRIALMRESGLSLEAIAATLNAEGVPTPRGGARWRPSSVQSALGYRRPRPPAPGAPPPPPRHAGPGSRRPPGPRRPPAPPRP